MAKWDRVLGVVAGAAMVVSGFLALGGSRWGLPRVFRRPRCGWFLGGEASLRLTERRRMSREPTKLTLLTVEALSVSESAFSSSAWPAAPPGRRPASPSARC